LCEAFLEVCLVISHPNIVTHNSAMFT